MAIGLCTGQIALGDSEAWHRFYADPGEVYLFRVLVSGAQIRDVSDALALLRAVATAQGMDLDARAITVADMPDGRQLVDVVMTVDSTTAYVLLHQAETTAERAAADPELRARFPNLVLSSPAWLELTGPPDALDFWRAHVRLYDNNVGLTQSFANGDGVYKGHADDGPRATPWRSSKPPLDDRQPPSRSAVTLAALGIAALAAVVWLYPRSRRRAA